MTIKARHGEDPDIVHIYEDSPFGAQHTLGRYVPSENLLYVFREYAHLVPQMLNALSDYLLAHRGSEDQLRFVQVAHQL